MLNADPPAPAVEQASTADIAALTALRLAYLEEDLGPLDEQTASTIRRRLPGYLVAHLGRDLFAWAVRADGDIVSCALLLVVEKPMSPAFPNGRTGTVLNVYTRPAYRRRGLAREVMRALMDSAHALELCPVELKATAEGRPLYGSLGFEEDRSKYIHMKWEAERDGYLGANVSEGEGGISS